MIKKTDRNQSRKKRHLRVRKKIVGTAVRPRLNVFRSGKNIYAQLINDEAGTTILSASTLGSDFGDTIKSGGTVEAAERVGELIANKAIEQGYKTVVFDRGGYLFHGRVKSLADGARKGGLEF